MYLTFAVLRRYEAEGRRPEDLPLVHWGAQYGLERIQESFEGLLRNFEVPVLGAWLRGPVLWWSRLNAMGAPPSDRLGGQVAARLRQPGTDRDRLTTHLFQSTGESALGDLEEAFELAAEATPIAAKIRQAMRRKTLTKGVPEERLAEAEAAEVITAEERKLVERAREARLRAIAVDAFTLEELQGQEQEPPRAAVA